MNEPYYSFNTFLKTKFGKQKVRKIPINAGFECPNKDGTLSDQGCIFCDEYGSGPIKTYGLSIEDQIEHFIQAHPGIKYIAYYQAHTNTHAPRSVLKSKYSVIFSYPDIVGLFIGTRPDAIKSETFPLLEKLNKEIYFTIELGLQSIHEKSLIFLNRNHNYSHFLDVFQQLKRLQIDVVVHLIVGIPGETTGDMLETIKEMNRLQPAGIKFHLFHVLKNTPLFHLYQNQQFRLMSFEEYIGTIVCLLEHLDPSIVIHRLTGERERELFYKPVWALQKAETINAIKTRMKNSHTFQGKRLNELK
jgi:radical SAM protein (TIGR01212 family)